MSDGDIVHSQLSGFYRKPYQALCERKATNDECARFTITALLQDIKEQGATPVLLALQMGESLRHRIDNGCGNWAVLREELDRLVQRALCPHSLKELVRRARDGILHDLRYGKIRDTRRLPEALVERYFQELYRSNFEQRLPLTPKHYAGVDNVTLTNRVEGLRQYIFPAIGKWAKQVNADGDVTKLRLPPRQNRQGIDDYEENLL